ncbi:hypothetical protein [Actinophytocola sp.]
MRKVPFTAPNRIALDQALKGTLGTVSVLKGTLETSGTPGPRLVVLSALS